MKLDSAILAEREGRLIEAADIYEKLLIKSSSHPDVFLNLLILYWQVTDYGFWTESRLPLSFVKRAGKRLGELLLDQEYEEFRGSSEATFWSKYIPWADWGKDFSIEECLLLLEEDKSCLIPVIYLLTQHKLEQWRAEALELLEEYRDKGTLKSQYIQSYLEAAIKMEHWKPYVPK